LKTSGCEDEAHDDVESFGTKRFGGRLEEWWFVLRAEANVESAGARRSSAAAMPVT